MSLKPAQIASIKAQNRWNDIKNKGCMKCNTCSQIKPLSEYRKYKNTTLRTYDSWCSTCKDCNKIVQIKSVRKRISRIDQKITVILNSARQRCLKNNREFDLTKDFILDLYDKQNGKCYYTNLELLPYNDHSNHQCISIDRIDSNKGYTKGNVVLCCWIINRIKLNLSVEEFIKYCSLVSNNNKY